MKLFKKILEINKTYPTYAAVAVLCGALCLAPIEGGATVAMLVTSGLLLLYSVLRISGAFMLEGSGGSAFSIFISVGVMLFAASIIASPEATYASLPALAGLYLVISGGGSLFTLSLYRSPTYIRISGKNPLSRPTLAIIAVIYAVTLALGILLLSLKPEHAYTLCALSLIISGVASFVAAFLKARPMKNPIQYGEYIEADFTDKTDQ